MADCFYLSIIDLYYTKKWNMSIDSLPKGSISKFDGYSNTALIRRTPALEACSFWILK